MKSRRLRLIVNCEGARASSEQLRARLELFRSGAAGVHDDQRKRRDAKRLRRDKSYRDWMKQ